MEFKDIEKAMASYNRRFNDDEYYEFQKCVRDVEDARMCLAVGLGTGLREIHFIKSCIPNLEELTAVDRDHDSLIKLKTNISSMLPDIEKCEIVESRIEDWGGPKEPVDVILAFNMLYYYVEATERGNLLRKLMEEWLKPGGKLIIQQASVENPLMKVASKLWPETGGNGPSAEDLAAQLEELGYTILNEYRFTGKMDYSDVDDDFVSLLMIGFAQEGSDPAPFKEELKREVPSGEAGEYAVILVATKRL